MDELKERIEMGMRQDGPTNYGCDECDAIAQSDQTPPSLPTGWIQVTEIGATTMTMFCSWACLSSFAAAEHPRAEQRAAAKAARTVERAHERTP